MNATSFVGFGGVVLGVVGTWITQWLTRRQTSQLSVAARRSALRDDRRDAIYAFLEATQDLDRLIDTKKQTGDWNEAEARAATHRMYFRFNCLSILASPSLQAAAGEFKTRMFQAAWDPNYVGDRDVYAFMRDLRDPLIDAATDELYAPEIYDSSGPHR